MYKDKQTYDLIVIGGGSSGMMAAGRAAEGGARVLLLEKNRRLGKKLGITGGGRCNITNAETDIRAFLDNFGEAKEFLFSPFSQFGVKETFHFFDKLNLPVVVQSRKRAFPETENAEDVVDAMERYVRDNKVEIHFNTKIRDIEKLKTGGYKVTSSKEKVFSATNLAIATGGLAAPETGSTGDGFDFLHDLGHTIYEPNPTIVPLTTDARWIHELSGTTLSFMKLSFLQKGKVGVKKTGKILFTHFGISGPLVLNCSKDVIEMLKTGRVEASVDMFPDTNEGELDRRVVNLFEKNKNKMLKNIFSEILPKSMVMTVLNLLELSEREVNSITRDERKELVKMIKDLRFPITGTLGYEKAVIADGGVLLEEVDFRTMESRIHKGLYLLGDILHINRPSGGFSLQLCWTTGWVAGSHVANSIHKDDSEE